MGAWGIPGVRKEAYERISDHSRKEDPTGRHPVGAAYWLPKV